MGRFRKNLSIAMMSVHSSPLGLLGTSDTGGMSVYIRELASELGRSGHRVDIYTRDSSGSGNSETELSEDVRLIEIDAGDNGADKDRLYDYLPAFYSSMQCFVRANRLKYDLVHSHYWLSGKVGGWASRRWGVPHMIMFHTCGAAKQDRCRDESEPYLRISHEKKLALQSSRILAPTERERGLISRLMDVSPSKISLVPCGVNLKRFYPRPREYSRRAIGVDPDAHLILYVGRFAPVKGIDRLLSSVSLLRNTRAVNLMIVGGDGPEARSTLDVKRMVRKMGLDDIVSFRGRIDHDILPFYYSAADVLAVPSYYESFGLVALEALACGTPVVASRVGAMDMVISDGETGYVVDPFSTEEFAEMLGRSLLRSHTSAWRPDFIRQTVTDYAWSSVASSVALEYESALRAQAAGDSECQNEFQRRRVGLVS